MKDRSPGKVMEKSKNNYTSSLVMSTLFHMNVPKSTDFDGPIMNDEKSVTEKCPTQIQFIDLQVR